MDRLYQCFGYVWYVEYCPWRISSLGFPQMASTEKRKTRLEDGDHLYEQIVSACWLRTNR